MGVTIRPPCKARQAASAVTSGRHDRPAGGHHDRARRSTALVDHQHHSWNNEHNGWPSDHHSDHGGATSGFYHDHRSGWRDRR